MICNNRTLINEYREKRGLLPNVSQQEEIMTQQSQKKQNQASWA
jgi:hypothetical protein